MRLRVALPVLLTTVAMLVAGAPAVAERGVDGIIRLPDGFETEGVTSAPDGTFYATSLVGRGIWTGNLRDGTSERFVRLPGTSLRGTLVHPRTGTVWAVGSRGDRGIAVVLDPAADDPVVGEVTLPGAGFPNDLTFSGGKAWITDSVRDQLFRVVVDSDGAPGDVSVRPLSGAWDPVEDDPPDTFAANGIRTLADGTLVLVDSRDGGLYQVFRRDGTAVEIPVSGRKDLLSGDGLVRDGATLYVVRGRAVNRIQVLSLARAGDEWSATYRASVGDPDLSVPSTATLDAGSLWAVNAQFGTGDNTYEVVRVALPGTAPVDAPLPR